MQDETESNTMVEAKLAFDAKKRKYNRLVTISQVIFTSIILVLIGTVKEKGLFKFSQQLGPVAYAVVSNPVSKTAGISGATLMMGVSFMPAVMSAAPAMVFAPNIVASIGMFTNAILVADKKLGQNFDIKKILFGIFMVGIAEVMQLVLYKGTLLQGILSALPGTVMMMMSFETNMLVRHWAINFIVIAASSAICAVQYVHYGSAEMAVVSSVLYVLMVLVITFDLTKGKEKWGLKVGKFPVTRAVSLFVVISCLISSYMLVSSTSKVAVTGGNEVQPFKTLRSIESGMNGALTALDADAVVIATAPIESSINNVRSAISRYVTEVQPVFDTLDPKDAEVTTSAGYLRYFLCALMLVSSGIALASVSDGCTPWTAEVEGLSVVMFLATLSTIMLVTEHATMCWKGLVFDDVKCKVSPDKEFYIALAAMVAVSVVCMIRFMSMTVSKLVDICGNISEWRSRMRERVSLTIVGKQEKKSAIARGTIVLGIVVVLFIASFRVEVVEKEAFRRGFVDHPSYVYEGEAIPGLSKLLSKAISAPTAMAMKAVLTFADKLPVIGEAVNAVSELLEEGTEVVVEGIIELMEKVPELKNMNLDLLMEGFDIGDMKLGLIASIELKNPVSAIDKRYMVAAFVSIAVAALFAMPMIYAMRNKLTKLVGTWTFSAFVAVGGLFADNYQIATEILTKVSADKAVEITVNTTYLTAMAVIIPYLYFCKNIKEEIEDWGCLTESGAMEMINLQEVIYSVVGRPYGARHEGSYNLIMNNAYLAALCRKHKLITNDNHVIALDIETATAMSKYFGKAETMEGDGIIMVKDNARLLLGGVLHGYAMFGKYEEHDYA